MLPTVEDIDFLIHILTSVDPFYPVTKGVETADRLKELRKLWEKDGLSVKQVDIIWASDQEFVGLEGHTQTVGHQWETYDVGDLKEDNSDWSVKDLKAHLQV